MTKEQKTKWTIKANEGGNIATRTATSTVTQPAESTTKHSCFLTRQFDKIQAVKSSVQFN